MVCALLSDFIIVFSIICAMFLVQIEELLPEEGLKTILELPSDEVTDTQRVHILRRALLVQSRTNISSTFAEVKCMML